MESSLSPLRSAGAVASKLMYQLALVLIASFTASAPAAPGTASKTPDPYTALRVYDGTWQVTRKGAAKADTLVNHCAVLGTFFACGQGVNGAPGGLVVFIPVNGQPGHYYTQTIMPEGRATGRDDLRIDGNQWTYSSRRDENGKTTYFRTVNTFSDKNHIHFEQAQSENNKDWSVQGSGDEVRSSAASGKH